MPKRIEFYPLEIKALQESPEALRALADRHSVWETEAAASDCDSSAYFHERRKRALRAEAARLEDCYEEGEGPGFGE